MSLRDYEAMAPLIKRLYKSIQSGSISHAYIIEGDRCIDKTAFVKDFIKGILCEEEPGYGCDFCVTCRKIDHDNYEDLYLVQSDDLSVKDSMISQLQEKLKGKPTGGMRNIAIIEDADTMTVRAQNRLLKTLEEPNAGTILFLLSENTENLLQTITSRCIIYRLGNYVTDNSEMDLEHVREMVAMAAGDAYFCDIRDKLTKYVKDRKEAFVFLDGMERLFREYLLDGQASPFRKEQIIKNVGYVEEARRDLLANVNYKYAIRNLILKIGG